MQRTQQELIPILVGSGIGINPTTMTTLGPVPLDQLAKAIEHVAIEDSEMAKDMAMLIVRMARRLRLRDDDFDLCDKALKYLKKHGLAGSALRTEQNPVQADKRAGDPPGALVDIGGKAIA